MEYRVAKTKSFASGVKHVLKVKDLERIYFKDVSFSSGHYRFVFEKEVVLQDGVYLGTRKTAIVTASLPAEVKLFGFRLYLEDFKPPYLRYHVVEEPDFAAKPAKKEKQKLAY